MSELIEPLKYVIVGMIAASVIDWTRGIWRQHVSRLRMDAANRILNQYGLDAYTYLAAFGAEDGELRSALESFELTNKVIVDKNGNIVGRLLPKVKAAEERGLRLVVDNTKP